MSNGATMTHPVPRSNIPIFSGVVDVLQWSLHAFRYEEPKTAAHMMEKIAAMYTNVRVCAKEVWEDDEDEEGKHGKIKVASPSTLVCRPDFP